MLPEIAALTVETSDYRPGISDAPVDMRVNPIAAVIFTVISGLPAVILLVVAIRAIVKRRNFTLLLFLVGGGLATFIEPILDYLNGLWWPLYGNWTAFTILGVNLPLFVPLVYPWYLGGEAYIAYRLFKRGITWGKLWAVYGTLIVVNGAQETIGLHPLGIHKYFGPQPFNFWGLPLWTMACNAVAPLFAGALFYVFQRRLTGVRTFASLGLFPFAFLGSYAAAGWPVWIALNSDWPMWAAVLCGFATLALAYVMLMLIAEMTGTGDLRDQTRSTRADTTDHVKFSVG